MFSPFNMEDLAAGAVEAFKLLGDARAIAVWSPANAQRS
jgi:hypothetical protein